jgi:hypothetical protein
MSQHRTAQPPHHQAHTGRLVVERAIKNVFRRDERKLSLVNLLFSARKENVNVGRLIPAGSGLAYHRERRRKRLRELPNFDMVGGELVESETTTASDNDTQTGDNAE